MLIQIVPALPPIANGVGDYGLTLACEMRRQSGVDTLLVVANERWEGPEQVEGFAARRLAARSAENLADVLCAASDGVGRPGVLLQLSVYGYSRRGCPFWLLEGLRRWKRKNPDGQLMTMFHELYATAPPWKSTFWVSPAQQMVVGGIARLSDVAVTNIQRYCDRLERFDPSKKGKIALLATPSSVGEPIAPSELGARAKILVVFGLPPSRKRAYGTRLAELQRACEQFGIEEVHDVGPLYEGIPERIGPVPVRKHGRMEGGDLNALLSQSMAGFVGYFPEYMGKSAVLAAYCAHRMLVVVPEDGRSEADGVRCGIHYYNVGAPDGAAPEPQTIADAAWNWYQAHSLRSHARTFAGALAQAEPPKGRA
jgi:hypothetical protein